MIRCVHELAIAATVLGVEDVPTLLRGGARHLRHMRWAEPGRLLEMVGPDSEIAVTVYNLTSLAAHAAKADCRAAVIHEERAESKIARFREFLDHLATEAQQTTWRAYLEDTYLYSADGEYANLAKHRGSAALHRLEGDLPDDAAVPAFDGFEHLAGVPYSAVALFVGNGSESSMHQDKGEQNFITQVHGCKHVVTAPPEAASVLGTHLARDNDAALDTSTLSEWGGLPGDGDCAAQDGLTLCGGGVLVPGARLHRLCAGDALYLPNSTWHALYGDAVEAGGPPSITVTFFLPAQPGSPA